MNGLKHFRLQLILERQYDGGLLLTLGGGGSTGMGNPVTAVRLEVGICLRHQVEEFVLVLFFVVRICTGFNLVEG